MHQGARWRALALPRRRRNVSVLRLMRPPSSTPNTTSLQRLARWSSGYVRRARARPGSLSAPGRALPSRLTELTIVPSTAIWAPCQRGRPFATTSMYRDSSPEGPHLLRPVHQPLCKCEQDYQTNGPENQKTTGPEDQGPQDQRTTGESTLNYMRSCVCEKNPTTYKSSRVHENVDAPKSSGVHENVHARGTVGSRPHFQQGNENFSCFFSADFSICSTGPSQ